MPSFKSLKYSLFFNSNKGQEIKPAIAVNAVGNHDKLFLLFVFALIGGLHAETSPVLFKLQACMLILE